MFSHDTCSISVEARDRRCFEQLPGDWQPATDAVSAESFISLNNETASPLYAISIIITLSLQIRIPFSGQIPTLQ